MGTSDGAILGLLLAMDYPKKVKRVLAFGANIQPDSLAVFPWAIAESEKIVKGTGSPNEKKLNQLMLDYPNIPYTKLSQIKAPVLIMSGDRDVIRPEHILKTISEHTKLATMYNTGSHAWSSMGEKRSFFNDNV
jgi:pimeloyl-ACP methyl ester carboxylesterase